MTCAGRSGGGDLRPPCEESGPPTFTAETVHPGSWNSHGESSAPPAAGHASSPAATPVAHAASTNSASAPVRMFAADSAEDACLAAAAALLLWRAQIMSDIMHQLGALHRTRSQHRHRAPRRDAPRGGRPLIS